MTTNHTTLLANAKKNATDPLEIFHKVKNWFSKDGRFCLTSQVNQDPVLFAKGTGQHASISIHVGIDRVAAATFIHASFGVKVPECRIPKINEFIDQVNTFALTPLYLEKNQKSLASCGLIYNSNDDSFDDYIKQVSDAFTQTIDDCVPPVLSIIFGNKTVESAVTDFKLAQKLAIADPEADLVCIYCGKSCNRLRQ